MKPWQKGFDLDYLKELELRFSSYNDYAQHELSKFKKNNIADALSKDNIILLRDDAIIHFNEVKVKSKISMFSGVTLSEKQPGDIQIKQLGYSSESSKRHIVEFLFNDYRFQSCGVWLFINEENLADKQIAKETQFEKVGVKYTSVADIIGVYFRDANNVFEDRKHFEIPKYEEYTLKKLTPDFSNITSVLSKQLHELNIDFTNHYSNYNKAKSWSAISLRGYKNDYKFITKPIEMNKKWKEDNKNEVFEMQDTDWRKKFSAVEDILKHFQTEIHRVRFMKLKPGGGELQRHTDQVDPDMGIADGKLMRIHVPIKTNPNVEFTSWSTNGTKDVVNMSEGSCWYLDIRKPHMAINKGDDWRTHLVIDVVANEQVRSLLYT